MKVTKYNLRQLKTPYKRVLLELLGCRLPQQPTKASGRDELMYKYLEERPDEVERLFNLVKFGKFDDATSSTVLPTDIANQIETAKSHIISVIKDTAIEEVISLSDERIKSQQEELGKLLMKAAKEELAKAASNYRPIVIKNGSKQPKKLKGVFPDEFEGMVQLASQRVPVMLVGPAGCGKTFIASKVAEALSLPFADQSCSEGISESTFTGWLLPVGASGKFDYVAAPFITMYESGGVFLLDEMDSADANLLTFLNKAIANDFFFLPQRFGNPKVVKHQDFTVIAAANTYGLGADAQYVGRNQLDAATLDRFQAGTINMDYSSTVEEAIIDPDVLEWGRKVRKVIADRKLLRIMSTRVMKDMTTMKHSCGWDMESWNDRYFSSWTDDERRFAINAVGGDNS